MLKILVFLVLFSLFYEKIILFSDENRFEIFGFDIKKWQKIKGGRIQCEVCVRP